MNAMILAAGKGTRLYPLTETLPKPMVPVAGEPVLYHTLRWLRRHDIHRVAINLYHLAATIQNDLGNGSRFGVNIHYSTEEQLLGTAGGVKRMADFLEDPFIVIYGDVLTDLDLNTLVAFHSANGSGRSHATLTLDRRPEATHCGVVDLGTNNRVTGFVEKPKPEDITSPWVNSGIMVLDHALLELIPSGRVCDFGREVLPDWLARGIPLFGWQLPNTSYLIDMGTPEKYAKANRDWPGRMTGMADYGS